MNKISGSILHGVLLVALVLVVAGGAWYYYDAHISQNPANIPNPPNPLEPVSPTNSSSSPTSSTIVTTPNLFQANDVTDANNQFAIDLYARYASEEFSDANIFFSPFSISSAMAMVYEGAKGQTAQEIAGVFHFPADIAQVRSGYQAALVDINSNAGSYTLTTANALWVQKNFQLFSSYTNAVKTYYDGSITNLDFANDPSAAVSTINQWVANQTANKIQNILSSSDVNQKTRLILTNAIYFKATWQDVFNKSATQQKVFTTSSGSNSQVPVMEQTSNFPYADVGSAQLLQLPYRGNGVSMFVLLPKDNNLSALNNDLGYQKIIDWEKELKTSFIDVSLPKFDITTEEHMPPDLEAMGMPTAFSPADADFSGIAPIANPSQNLYISDVIHKAFIDTDENGTEAAAATAVVMEVATAVGPPPPQPIIFNANHPFIFFIQQDQTGDILFMGRVANP